MYQEEGVKNVRRKAATSSVTLDAGERSLRTPTPPERNLGGSMLDDDLELLRQLQGWWDEARDYHAPNRREQLIDADFYDNHQYDPESARKLMDRGQMPTVYNLCALAVDWIIGTEARTRIEGKVLPRGPEDVNGAQAKQQVLKYVDDVNQAGFERSAAFADATKVGIGWLEECVVSDPDDEPITNRYVDWKHMWWDPFSRRPDFKDCRYVTRRKWLDLDYAQAMWPQHAEALAGMARRMIDIELGDTEDLGDLPAMFINRDLRTTMDNGYRLFGTSTIDQTHRRRIAVNETWYKRPVQVKRIRSLDPDLNTLEFDEDNPVHADALENGVITLTDAVAERIFLAMWVPKLLLSSQASPYKHHRYPFTAVWCKREDRTGMPYGYIRGMRDAQTDFNKRRSKALFLLSVNRAVVEDGAVDLADEDDFKEEMAAPDAFLRVNKGALANKQIELSWGAELVPGQVELMNEAKNHILEGSGITRENLGQDSKAISGRAILAKQQQGSVSTAQLFDNYRRFMQISGQKTLSLIEQFMSLPKRLRILGPRGKIEWLLVNEPMTDPGTGEIYFSNDLTGRSADYVVDQQDYRETVRMAQSEMMFEIISKLPPEYQLPLLDLAFELTDIPNKDEFVQRIRKMNGMPPPGQDMDEAQVAAEQQKQDQQNQMAALDVQERTARINKDMASAAKLQAEAKAVGVKGKREAIDTAGLIAAALPLAPAADRLYQAPTPPT